MLKRTVRFGALAAALVLLATASPVEAKYRYGRPSGGGAVGERGFFVQLEGLIQNPRDTDAVVATVETIQDFGGGVNQISPVLPAWDDEFSGRLTAGYAWANGNRIWISGWNFNAEQGAAGTSPPGGTVHFAIGPPIRTGGDFVGDSGTPGAYDIVTEIEASTFDAAWGRSAEVGDALQLEWSLGLRVVEYDETSSGYYDEDSPSGLAYGQNGFDAFKSNHGEMVGVRAGIRGDYRVLPSISVNAGLAFGVLDGELEAFSGLTPVGSVNGTGTPASRAEAFDDGRSGQTRDLDLSAVWHLLADRLRLSFGWEQSRWDGIPADLVRNFPGTAVPLAPRESMTFSGYKLGVYYRF